MKAYERLLKYVAIHTKSDDESESVPSTARQFDLAKLLVEEMKSIGVADAHVDDMCYVYGSIPASKGYEDKPAIGFIAHMDTAPDFNGENVRPRLIENYDGGEVVLGDSGRSLRPAEFPHLTNLKGRTLIVTDGTSLLGADDKAGVAEIMTAAERIIKGGMPHGKLLLAFTPDEEVGRGADHFDVEHFGADFAYTVDGGQENVIEYENFNAAACRVEINGFNVHPGSAKNTMINALLVGCEFNSMLPSGETPRDTMGYEGFFHLCDMKGTVEHAVMDYIIRDHSSEIMTARKATIRHIEALLNEKYGEGTVKVTLKDQYLNMVEKIKPCFHLIENACEAVRELGMESVTEPIRGGTDGARLSFMGLPCPNLGTGGYAYHGPYEHITVEGMELATEVILGIVKRYAK
ncbi:MAG: peptidase T [Clostridiales bacterium]|nr:peptidase T [Clostridiales bacterium]